MFKLITHFTLVIAFTQSLLYSHSSDSSTTRATIYMTEQSLKVYKLKFGNYPTEEQGLEALVEHEFVEYVPEDAWGDNLMYFLKNGEPFLFSKNYHHLLRQQVKK